MNLHAMCGNYTEPFVTCYTVAQKKNSHGSEIRWGHAFNEQFTKLMENRHSCWRISM